MSIGPILTGQIPAADPATPAPAEDTTQAGFGIALMMAIGAAPQPQPQPQPQPIALSPTPLTGVASPEPLEAIAADGGAATAHAQPSAGAPAVAGAPELRTVRTAMAPTGSTEGDEAAAPRLAVALTPSSPHTKDARPGIPVEGTPMPFRMLMSRDAVMAHPAPATAQVMDATRLETAADTLRVEVQVTLTGVARTLSVRRAPETGAMSLSEGESAPASLPDLPVESMAAPRAPRRLEVNAFAPPVPEPVRAVETAASLAAPQPVRVLERAERPSRPARVHEEARSAHEVTVASRSEQAAPRAEVSSAAGTRPMASPEEPPVAQREEIMPAKPSTPADLMPATDPRASWNVAGTAPRVDRAGATLSPPDLPKAPPIEVEEKVARPTLHATIRFEGEQGLEGRMRVSLHGDQLRATILTPNAEVARRMEGDLAALQQSLRDRGFTTAQVAVRSGVDGATVAADARGSSQESSDGQDRSRARDDRSRAQQDTRDPGDPRGSRRSRRQPGGSNAEES